MTDDIIMAHKIGKIQC